MTETRDEMRRRFKMLARRWIFPASEWEAQVVHDIQKLSEYRIVRASPDQLAWARMPAQHCHANARWYQNNDPEKLTKHVTGWWRQDDVYILHSVIERDGTMICITPSPLDADSKLAFIPDSALSWTDDGVSRICMRNGQEVNYGVRANPEAVIRNSKIMITKLNSGGDPIRAATSIIS